MRVACAPTFEMMTKCDLATLKERAGLWTEQTAKRRRRRRKRRKVQLEAHFRKRKVVVLLANCGWPQTGKGESGKSVVRLGANLRYKRTKCVKSWPQGIAAVSGRSSFFHWPFFPPSFLLLFLYAGRERRRKEGRKEVTELNRGRGIERRPEHCRCHWRVGSGIAIKFGRITSGLAEKGRKEGFLNASEYSQSGTQAVVDGVLLSRFLEREQFCWTEREPLPSQ